MENENKKLTSSEIEEMLKEVEKIHKPLRTSNNNRKKKKKIRLDIIIAAVVVVALVIGGISLISKLTKKVNINKAEKATVENPLIEEKYPEISDVIYNYLKAYLIADPQQRLTVLAQYVDNMGDTSEGDIVYKDYIKSYSGVECYSKNGPYEDTYVVYAYFQMEFKNIATTAPGIYRFYVIRDADTGNVYIHNGVSKEINDYMNKVSKEKDVQQLFADVNKEFEDAKASDPQLKDFFDKLESDKGEEATTVAAATEAATTAAEKK